MPGDTVVFSTAGITEARNSHNEMSGTGRLTSTIRENLARSPNEILDAVIAAVLAFSHNEPQFDNITPLVIRVV